MKTINNIIVMCVLASLQAHGAQLDDETGDCCREAPGVYQMCQLLNLWSRDDKSQDSYALFKGKLDNFVTLDSKINAWIEGVAVYANLFEQHNIEDDIFFLKLSDLSELRAQYVEWYKEWGRRLGVLSQGLTDDKNTLKQRSALNEQALCVCGKCLRANDGDSVLTPIQVAFDSKHWCSNLENLINRLQEILDLENNLSICARQCKEEVVCYVRKESLNGEKLLSSLSDLFNNKGCRSRMIGNFEDSFSQFLKMRLSEEERVCESWARV